MEVLSKISQKLKTDFFFKKIPKECKILEIGCGNYWLGNYLKDNGWKNYVGLDVKSPADIVGSIKNWKKLGLKEGSFDFIVAFEVIEHIDILKECHDLLKPGGCLLATTPVPHTDWLLKLLETIGLNQKRASKHSNLVYLKNVTLFRDKKIKYIIFLSQWAILKKYK